MCDENAGNGSDLAHRAGGGPSPTPVRVLSASMGRVVVNADGEKVFVQADEPAPVPVLRAIPASGGRIVVNADGERVFVQSDEPAPVPVLPTLPASTGRIVVNADGQKVFIQTDESPQVAPPAGSGDQTLGAAGRVLPRPGNDAGVRLAGAAVQRVPLAPAEREPAGELEEIIGFAPGGLLRWGTTAVFGVMLALLATSWFIRYPETVDGRATVTTPAPPVRLAARAAAELRELRAADGERVSKGQLLAVLESSANADHMLRLGRWIDAVDPAGPVPPPPSVLELGEVQGAFADFVRGQSDLRAFDATGYYVQKEAHLAAQIETQERLRGSLQSEQRILEQDLQLALAERDRNRELARRELLSQQELEKAEQAYLQKQHALQNGYVGVLTGDVQLAAQRTALLDLERSRAEERRRYELAVRTGFAELRAAVALWEQKYLLRAPAAGRVSFFKPLAVGQVVAASEPVMAVVPETGGPVARVEVGPADAGKVRPGQAVLLEFDSYPRMEWGVVRGRVRRVASVGNRNADGAEPVYQVQVTLDRELRTSSGRVLPFQQEMTGKANVVIRDLRLMERLFAPLRGAARSADR